MVCIDNTYVKEKRRKICYIFIQVIFKLNLNLSITRQDYFRQYIYTLFQGKCSVKQSLSQHINALIQGEKQASNRVFIMVKQSYFSYVLYHLSQHCYTDDTKWFIYSF